MVVRMKITIEQQDYSALLKLALAEERNPEGQLRHILHNELKRLGLICQDPSDSGVFEDNYYGSTHKGVLLG